MCDTPSQLKEQLAVERYKYITSKIRDLDNAFEKNMVSSGKYITAIFGFLTAAVYAAKTSKITDETLVLAMNISSAMAIFICLLFIAITISGILSWIDYRKEEIEFFTHVEINIGRKPPNIANFYRWNEFWYVVALFIIGIIAYNIDCFIG